METEPVDEFENLIAQLNDENIRVSSNAAENLEKYGERAVYALVEASTMGKNFYVQQSSTAVLMRIGKPAIKPMIEMLNQKNSAGRVNAVRRLGTFGDEDAIEPLTECLNDNHKAVRYAAEKSLRLIRGEPVDQSELLNDLAGKASMEMYEATKKLFQDEKTYNRN